MKEKILLGMSGGVDSAFSAHLLREQGYEVVGAYLDMHEYSSPREAETAAADLKIELLIRDCRDEFKKNVREYFISEYNRGRTPNPCVVCNRAVKIQKLIEAADELGIKYIATGHYAKIKHNEKSGRFYPAAAEDARKDQSYVLWMLNQEQLSRLKTPLGMYTKNRIKAEAEKMGIKSAKSGESQDICFIPDGDYVSYLQNNGIILKKGEFIGKDGKVLGSHRGIQCYTPGQKRGLGIALGTKKTVIGINADNNTVTLGDPGDEYSQSLKMDSLNFCYDSANKAEAYECTAKIRYSAKCEPVTAVYKEHTAEITFSYPVKTVTPGQSCVLYTPDADGEPAVLCGGIINSI